MSMYNKFLVKEKDRFNPSNFPQLGASLESIVAELKGVPPGPKADMLLSFVKSHSINSQHVVDFPGAATLISTKSLPLGAMEDLFEASRSNPSFQKEMEAYIRSYLTAEHLY